MKNIFRFKSIRTKMIFGFSLVLLLIVILSLYNFSILNKSNKTVENISETELPIYIADERSVQLIYERVASARGYVISNNSQYKEVFNEATEAAQEYFEQIRSLGASEGFDNLVERTQSWANNIMEDVFGEYDRGNEEKAIENLVQADIEARELISEYKEFALNRENHIIALEKNILEEGKSTMMIVAVVSVIAIIAGVIIALITARSITNPLKLVTDRMELIADGDLRGENLEVRSEDETGHLTGALNRMQDKLKEIITKVTDASSGMAEQSVELSQSANEVTSASEQVAGTIQELASTAETQANHAGELSSSMQEFSEKIEAVNQNTEHMQELSQDVLQTTNEGSTLMDSSLEQMKQIDEAVQGAVQRMESLDGEAQKISKLVDVIHDVSQQTNLLALNASIEAARAGEHEKGFAVVANEVKSLADEVSESVADISDIVKSIQEESSLVSASLQSSYQDVEQGTHQIEETNEKFNDISEAITNVADRIKATSESMRGITTGSQDMNNSIQEIAAASEESSAGIEETSATTEQTSGAMEEVAHSSNELSKLADDLNNLVREFQL